MEFSQGTRNGCERQFTASPSLDARGMRGLGCTYSHPAGSGGANRRRPCPRTREPFSRNAGEKRDAGLRGQQLVRIGTGSVSRTLGGPSMKTRLLIPCTVVTVLALSLGVAWGQGLTTGTIAGTVVDSQGEPLPGVTIAITSNQGSKTVTTDENGRYTFQGLTVGTYTLKALLQDFNPLERTSLEVHLNEELRVDIKMTPGGTEEIEVVDRPPVIEPRSVTLGVNIPSKLVESVPTARNFSGLLNLAPGVAGSGIPGAEDSNPSIGGVERPREHLLRRRREHRQYRLWQLRVVLARVRRAGNRRQLRLHQGSSSEDRRLRAGVRRSAGRLRQSGDEDRDESDQGQRVHVLPGGRSRNRTSNHLPNRRGHRSSWARPWSISASRSVGPWSRTRRSGTPPSTPRSPRGHGGRRRQRATRPGFRPHDAIRRTTYNYAANASWHVNPRHSLTLSAFGDPSTGTLGPQRDDALVVENPTLRFSRAQVRW